jgi:hypothetical protein
LLLSSRESISESSGSTLEECQRRCEFGFEFEFDECDAALTYELVVAVDEVEIWCWSGEGGTMFLCE